MSSQTIVPVTGAANGVRDSASDDAFVDDEVTRLMLRATKPHLAEVTQTYVALAPLPVAFSEQDTVTAARPAPAKPERYPATGTLVEPAAARAVPLAATSAPARAAPTTTTSALSPEAIHTIAERLGIDEAKVPHLLELVRAQLAAQHLSFDSIIAIASANGVSEANAIAALVALAAPPKGDESLGPTTEPALVLAIYVTVFAADRFAMTLPAPDALRVASLGAEPLGRMAPEDIAITGLAVGRMVNAMPDMTRPEAMAAVTSLISTCPEAVARATREGTLDSKVAAARALADSHGDLGNRGQAFAAAFTLLTNCQNDEQARALFSRAVSVTYGAAPQVILSSARGLGRTMTAEAVRRAAVSDSKQRDSEDARFWDDRVEARLTGTLDRLGPFLDEYDRLRAKKLNAVPRAELVLALHSQLTRGGPQFYIALLSLLRRHSALCTRQGSRALRNLIVSSDERVGSYPQPVFA